MKSFQNIRTGLLAAILIAGAAGIAAADNATATPATGTPTQQQTGATTAPLPAGTEASAVTTAKPKKKERIRRAERGTKSSPKR